MSPDAAPQPTPEGELIRRARKALGLKISQAAAATNGRVSATRWSQIETGREPRRGELVQARGTDVTLAHLAAVVGVTSQQLIEAGRDDAAEVLGDMERMQQAPPADGPQAAVAERPRLQAIQGGGLRTELDEFRAACDRGDEPDTPPGGIRNEQEAQIWGARSVPAWDRWEVIEFLRAKESEAAYAAARKELEAERSQQQPRR